MSFAMSQPVPSESLSVSGLPLYLTNEQLQAVFSQYGTVEQCKMLEPIAGLPNRGALVTMATVDEGTWLVQNVNNNIPSGLTEPVTVRFLAPAADVAPGAPLIDAALLARFLTPPEDFVAPVAPGIDAATLAALSALTGGLDTAGFFGAAGWPAAAPAQADTAGLFGPAELPAGMGLCGPAELPSGMPVQADTAGLVGPAALPPPAFKVGIPLTGTVKRWEDQKGFGFIVPDGGGPDVFVHIGDLPGGSKLVNGTRVTFEARSDPSKGPGRYRAQSCSGGIPKEIPTSNVAITDNLFITGLPLDISEETARTVFSQYGKVVSLRKLQNQPGKADAACLVRMENSEQAEWLVKHVSSNIPTGLTTPCSIRFAENKNKTFAQEQRTQGPGRPRPY